MVAQKSPIQVSRERLERNSEHKKEHKCEKCNKVFKSAWGLVVHNGKMHSDKPKAVKHHKTSRNGSESSGEGIVPHYCPNCGCNMRVIALALKFNANKE
jgi:predicted RNA-binding Zn-ribbon protein involved in translation (DUF1610 family)